MKFDRISINPKVMMGKPCIKGTRITVELILEKLSQGADYNYLLKGYLNLTIEDMREAIAYAHAVLTNEKIIEAEPCMKIIADESLNFEFISFLRDNNFEIFSIAENHPSVVDAIF